MASDNKDMCNILNDQESLKITLNVQQFRPEQLSVRIVDDFIVIEGKHQENSDEYGFVSRQFTRRYKVPDNVDKDALKCHLSSDGVLQIVAPKMKNLPVSVGRSIPIVQTNKYALRPPTNEDSEKN